MKYLTTLAVGTASALASGVSSAQNGTMMNGGGGMWGGGWMGGYGGFWGPIVLVVVIGLVIWIVMQKRK